MKQIDAKAFWSAVGQRAMGVSVVTAKGPDGPAGFLGLSTAHVCANPPTMLVSIDKTTSALAAVLAGRHFAINYLAHDQQAIADMFGGKGFGQRVGSLQHRGMGHAVLGRADTAGLGRRDRLHVGGDDRALWRGDCTRSRGRFQRRHARASDLLPRQVSLCVTHARAPLHETADAPRNRRLVDAGRDHLARAGGARRPPLSGCRTVRGHRTGRRTRALRPDFLRRTRPAFRTPGRTRSTTPFATGLPGHAWT